MLLTLALLFGVYLAALSLVGLVVWLLARFAHPFLGAGFSLVLAAASVFFLIDGMRECAQDPIYYPPPPGSSGDGREVFACDAPAGVFIYFSLYIAGPILVAALCALAYWAFRMQRKKVMPPAGALK